MHKKLQCPKLVRNTEILKILYCIAIGGWIWYICLSLWCMYMGFTHEVDVMQYLSMMNHIFSHWDCLLLLPSVNVSGAHIKFMLIQVCFVHVGVHNSRTGLTCGTLVRTYVLYRMPRKQAVLGIHALLLTIRPLVHFHSPWTQSCVAPMNTVDIVKWLPQCVLVVGI